MCCVQGLGWTNQTTACQCNPNRGGMGCEVDVPTLPQSALAAMAPPTVLVPTYNADMKLVWKSPLRSMPLLNTSWSLYTLEVS